MIEIDRVLAYIREKASPHRELVALPPFSLFFHAEKKDTANNFAILDRPVRGRIGATLYQLQAHFKERDCTPCLQGVDVFAPALAAELQPLGYEETRQWSILVCTAETYRNPEKVPGLAIEMVSSASSVAAVKEAWDANARGYDINAPLATAEEAEEFRQHLVNCRAFTARLNGQAVGAGMVEVIRHGVTELVGITTLGPYRRRGIAAVLTAHATQVAFSLGVELAFLVPESTEAARVYKRIGYAHCATMQSYTLPAKLHEP
jgi:GNAT superfamily N-acetyltransferase